MMYGYIFISPDGRYLKHTNQSTHTGDTGKFFLVDNLNDASLFMSNKIGRPFKVDHTAQEFIDTCTALPVYEERKVLIISEGDLANGYNNIIWDVNGRDTNSLI